MKPQMALMIAGLALLGGCATAGPQPVEVTRFHLGAPLERGTLKVEPVPGYAMSSLEFQTYAAAVQAEATRSGFGAAGANDLTQFVAAVGFRRETREGPPRESGVSIGLGGGGSTGGYRGGGVGLGGGISFPIGKRRARAVVVTGLDVTIRRRGDGTTVWEGHAVTSAAATAPEAQADATARKLAVALFRGFPGESGRTITVK